MKMLQFIEIDIEYCSRTYGESPCTAALGVTGTKKCFNTFKTCQDTEHYDGVPKTLRYADPTEYLPGDIDCIPSIDEVEFTPQVVKPGVSLGERATLTATFVDHPHSDTDLDKYFAERAYNPFEQGTYWAKFRARSPFVINRPLRWIIGTTEQTLSQMETRHFIIDSISGPGTDGVVQIIAKDILKVADGDQAQAPKQSTGNINADINDSETTITLDTVGLGDVEYPSAGSLCIGTEAMTFTRVGDVFTVVRGQHGTDPVEHKIGDLVQLMLIYDSQTAANLIYDLFVTYTQADPLWLPLSAWQFEVNTYINRVYDAAIGKPTPVCDLINEIIEHAGLVVWWDDIDELVRMRSLRPIAATGEPITDNELLQGTLSITDQPDLRVSQVWTSFSQLNPLEQLDKASNYGSGVVSINAQSEISYGLSAIKTIYSRWIGAFARSTAVRLNAQILSRYSDPPRQFSFAVDRSLTSVKLGLGYVLQSWPLQDDEGAEVPTTVIITSLQPMLDQYICTAEEAFFFEQDDLEGTHLIVIDQLSYNINLRTAHDNIYSSIPDDGDVLVVIEEGVFVGGKLIGAPSFDVGDWPSGVTITLQVKGRIEGIGGNGGSPFTPVTDGGLALYTRRPITVDNTSGMIWGGGGGGGGAIENGIYDVYVGGSGGAGAIPGLVAGNNFGPSNFAHRHEAAVDNGETVDHTNPLFGQFNLAGPGENGTTEAGGMRGGSFYAPYFRMHPGKGGDPGQAGEPGRVFNAPSSTLVTTQNGGAAGKAVDGDSYITWTALGDIKGARVN